MTLGEAISFSANGVRSDPTTTTNDPVKAAAAPTASVLSSAVTIEPPNCWLVFSTQPVDREFLVAMIDTVGGPTLGRRPRADLPPVPRRSLLTIRRGKDGP